MCASVAGSDGVSLCDLDKRFQNGEKAWVSGAIAGTDLCEESGQLVEVVVDALGDMLVGGMPSEREFFVGAITVEAEGVSLRSGGVGVKWAGSHVGCDGWFEVGGARMGARIDDFVVVVVGLEEMNVVRCDPWRSWSMTGWCASWWCRSWISVW